MIDRVRVVQRLLPFAVALAAVLPAQEPITAEQVRGIMSFLASDEMRGRDTPSPELETAADYIEKRFAALKLAPIAEGRWSHRYTLPGAGFEAAAFTLKVRCTLGDKNGEVELKPGEDACLLWPGAVPGAADEAATVALHGDPRIDRMLMGGSGRSVLLLEIEQGAKHPQWSTGKRSLMGGRRQGGKPVFLVRKGVLPQLEGDGDRIWTVTWQAPAPEPTEIPLRNPVAVLRGSTKPDEYVIVSAHYDHIGVGAPIDGDAIRNGADDNATGTTAVLLLAEALAKGPAPQRSVMFVCFSAEEKGLRGSAAFAAQPPFPLEQMVCNVNIEMIGRPREGRQKCAWFTGAEYSDFAAIAASALQRKGIETIEFEMGRQLFGASDNMSFARKGIVAHSISAGSLHADYHQPGDELAKIDLEHMAAVIEGLREVVLEFANRAARPAWNDAGKEALKRFTERR